MSAITVHGIPRVRAQRKQHKPPKTEAAGAKHRRRRKPSNAELLAQQYETGQ